MHWSHAITLGLRPPVQLQAVGAAVVVVVVASLVLQL